MEVDEFDGPDFVPHHQSKLRGGAPDDSPLAIPLQRPARRHMRSHLPPRLPLCLSLRVRHTPASQTSSVRGGVALRQGTAATRRRRLCARVGGDGGGNGLLVVVGEVVTMGVEKGDRRLVGRLSGRWVTGLL